MPAAGAVYVVCSVLRTVSEPAENRINKWQNGLHREREKIKQTERLDEQRKREERQSSGSRNFEEMLAYVDETGVLHTTPPEVGEREEIDASQIEVSVPRRSEPEEIVPFEVRVEYFDAAKGYGFIRNSDNGEKYFSLSGGLPQRLPRAIG